MANLPCGEPSCIPCDGSKSSGVFPLYDLIVDEKVPVFGPYNLVLLSQSEHYG